MSERQRRQLSAEFKREPVRLVTEGGQPVGQVARALGIRPEMLSCGPSLASLTRLAAGLLYHSDRGVPNASAEYQARRDLFEFIEIGYNR